MNNQVRPAYVVGIGASAGGLEALESFFRAMPVNSGMAFVVIQHLSPDFESLMGEQLQRYTTMPVIPVTDRNIVTPNTIYLLTPKKDMVLEGDELISTDRPTDKVLSLPINGFFRSLANSWGEKAVAIVLSGTGSDGSAGIMDVHESGGLVLVQSAEDSRFDGMPRSAIATGCVDLILCPEEMPAALNVYSQNPEIKFDYPSSPKEPMLDAGIPTIFELLHSVYDIDFNFYKPQTITRRIERRIALHPEHISIEEYGRRIQNDRAELDLLYKDLLIGVTRFFRDPEAFDILRQTVIPSILKTRGNDENEVRVWVCGCSTGEEAYSIAILFLEAFETLGKEPHLKILATDLHRESLRFAAEGLYSKSSFPEMPEELREKYFISQTDGSYKVIADLRKTLIFSAHNVLKDPPFTRIDLVSCRNLLIYLQSTAQTRAIAFFHFALKLNGYLMLGASEGLGELANQFRIEDQHWKVFAKIREDRLNAKLRAPMSYTPAHTDHQVGAKELRMGRVYDTLLARFIPAGILVNDQQEAVHIFGNAARYLRPPTGRVSTELFAMVDGNLRVALMTALRNAEQRKTCISLKGIHFVQADVDCHLNITVEPLPENTENIAYYIVLLEEQVPDTQNLNRMTGSTLAVEIDNQATTQIHHLESELRQTRESLQSTVEELETINEELQAANEELLAANEELQSTNEELHSVNEELYSVNAEHEQKICELNTVSSNLNNLIRSTELATVFLDSDGLIQLFTPKAVEIFPLVPRDIGRDLRHFQTLHADITLHDDIASVFAGESVIEKQLAWGERTLLRRITPYQDVNKKVAGLTITYIDISDIKKAQQALRASANQFRLLAENTSDWIFITNENFLMTYNSPACTHITGYSPEEIASIPDFLKTILYPDYHSSYDTRDKVYANRDEQYLDMKILHRDGAERWIEYNCQSLYNDTGTLIGCCGSIRDITQRKKIETELRIVATAFESQEGIVITDANNDIIRVNIAFTRITGYSPTEVIGKNPNILHSDYQDSDFYEEMWRSINANGSWKGELWNKRKNGEIYPERLLITVIKNKEGQVTNYVGTLFDITESKAAEDEIKHLAFYDTLTHLPNRRLLLDKLHQALIASEHHGKIGALLFIDLDNFKTLNDTLGHDIGDILLQEVALRLRSCIRDTDTVARLGGDEFVMILSDLSELLTEAQIHAQFIAKKIRLAINQPYQLLSHQHHTSGSIGITFFKAREATKEELLKQADIAMYEAKSAGRNTVCFFNPMMQDTINTRVIKEQALQQALDKEQFVLYYQAQNTDKGKIVSAEVLIRWQHPENGLVYPADFIYLAEQTGMIMPIGQWVLEQACAQLKAWEHNPLTQHLELAVNVSARQFHQADFVQQVCKVIDHTAINPDKLTLELTESLVLDDVSDTVTKMKALCAVGVHFSMDDFGTGCSSLSNLTKLPINELKIDYSFVRNVMTDTDDAAIVQTIIAMARNLGLKVVAEGVETQEQREFLERHGCLIYQGYLFGKPVPLHEFERLLTETNGA